MKIALAQTAPIPGDITANIADHLLFIEKAATLGANAIFFSELSLTGYEPTLAHELAIVENDPILDPFEEISIQKKIIIGVGMPTKAENGLHISMFIFQPDGSKTVYSKQQLHEDELPFFINGLKQEIISHKNQLIVPAICFESLQPDHINNAMELGATCYLASVAKSENGLQKAYSYYSASAKKHQIPIAMVNCVGEYDGMICKGQSAFWNQGSELIYQMNAEEPGLLLIDLESSQTDLIV